MWPLRARAGSFPAAATARAARLHSAPHTLQRTPTRRRVFALLQIAFAVAVVGFAGRVLLRQWRAVGRTSDVLRLDWGLVVGASLLVLVSYALLIQTWRLVLARWGAHLAYGDAARVWTVSNLGKYVPGKVWQITAMGAMVHRRGISPLVAGASSVLITLVNTVVGFALVLALGARALDPAGRGTGTALVAVALLGLGLVLAPAALPVVVRLLGRVTGRALALPTVPASAVWIAAIGSAAAWLLYGVAFRVFVAGVTGSAAGATTQYIAVFTGSYLIGFITLFSPGGFGTRELAMTAALAAFGLATPPQAAMITVGSRLWLTVLELVPGLLFLAGQSPRRLTPTPPDASP